PRFRLEWTRRGQQSGIRGPFLRCLVHAGTWPDNRLAQLQPDRDWSAGQSVWGGHEVQLSGAGSRIGEAFPALPFLAAGYLVGMESPITARPWRYSLIALMKL